MNQIVACINRERRWTHALSLGFVESSFERISPPYLNSKLRASRQTVSEKKGVED